MAWDWGGAGLGGIAGGILGGPLGTFGGGAAGGKKGKDATWDFLKRVGDPGGIFADPQSAKLRDRDPAAMARQREMLTSLQAASEGRGPSAAADQMRLGAGYGAAQAMGMAAGQAGMSPAQQARMAQQVGMEQRARANEQAAILRAKEQQAAMQLYADAVAQQNAMDLQEMGIQAQLAAENAKLGQVHQGGVLSAVGGLLGGLM